MDKVRYQEIFDSVQAIRASIGDIPSVGAAGVIQDRMRQFTDDFDRLKLWASEIRRASVEQSRVVRSLQDRIKMEVGVALRDPEISRLTGQQRQRERAEERSKETVDESRVQEDWLNDLLALEVVVENRVQAVKNSTSNLRKEWELLPEQQRVGRAYERTSLRPGERSNIGPAGDSVQMNGVSGDTNRNMVSVDELLSEM